MFNISLYLHCLLRHTDPFLFINLFNYTFMETFNIMFIKYEYYFICIHVYMLQTIVDIRGLFLSFRKVKLLLDCYKYI